MVTPEEANMKTAEDFLNKFLDGFDWPHWSKENAIKAMEAYAKSKAAEAWDEALRATEKMFDEAGGTLSGWHYQKNKPQNPYRDGNQSR